MTGQSLRQFQLQEKIGSGAMGVVYRAIDTRNSRLAAVKVIMGEQGGTAKTSKRFVREAEILQSFRHPNIVRFLGGGRIEGTLYIAMEFVAGGTLEQLLLQREFLPWRETVDIGIQVCDALQYAHDRSVIHRDLKPSNLMISDDGKIKLTDFGIAKDLDATALTADGRTLGTAAYMAPEQIRGKPEVSHRTDLYALGCVMYQMITGFPPFEGKTAIALMHSHLTEMPPRPSVKNPQIPIALDNLIMNLMAKEPVDRPWDAAAVGHILSELRKKAVEGKPVQMVFSGSHQPTRLGGPVDNSEISGFATRSRKTESVFERVFKRFELPQGQWLGTIGLAVGAVLVAALLVYQLLPPGPAYLYKHAASLMASDESSNWFLAKRDYIDDLQSRFPDYRREEVQAWVDKIVLDRASRRATVLEHPNLLASTRPKGDAEDLFLRTFTETEEATKLGLLSVSAQKWKAMADTLPPEAEFRGWKLLARARSDSALHELEKKRTAARSRLELADKAEAGEHADEAARIRQEVIIEYGRYPDLEPILKPARDKLPKSAVPKTDDAKPERRDAPAPPDPPAKPEPS
jgi:serine/threonine-protein kinase